MTVGCRQLKNPEIVVLSVSSMALWAHLSKWVHNSQLLVRQKSLRTLCFDSALRQIVWPEVGRLLLGPVLNTKTLKSINTSYILHFRLGLPAIYPIRQVEGSAWCFRS